jgi:hypothetical protein
MVIAHHTTMEEFLALPEDGLRHELVRGEIISGFSMALSTLFS